MDRNRKTILALLGALLVLSAFDTLMLTYAISSSEQRDRGSDVFAPGGLLMRNKELLGKDFDEFLHVGKLVNSIQARRIRMLRQRRQITVIQLLFTGATLYYVVKDKGQGKREDE